MYRYTPVSGERSRLNQQICHPWVRQCLFHSQDVGLALRVQCLGLPRVLVTFYFRLQIYFHFRFAVNWRIVVIYGNWGFAISFVHLPSWKYIGIYTCRGGACSRPWTFGPHVRWPTTRFSSLAACVKVIPVLTSTRSSRKLLDSGSPTSDFSREHFLGK